MDIEQGLETQEGESLSQQGQQMQQSSQVDSSQQQQHSQGLEGNSAAEQFFVEVVTKSAQRTVTPLKDASVIAQHSNNEHSKSPISSQQQGNASSQQSEDHKLDSETQLIDLGELLGSILKQFGVNVKQSYSLENIKLLIAEEDILTDQRSVLYELKTSQQSFFQHNLGKVATIGKAEIKAELAANSHNLILTLYTDSITVEGSADQPAAASFKIFDQLQYRDQKVLHDLAFAAKKALIREVESVTYEDFGIWKILTEDYAQKAQAAKLSQQAAQAAIVIAPGKQQTATAKSSLQATKVPRTSAKNPQQSQESIKNNKEASHVTTHAVAGTTTAASKTPAKPSTTPLKQKSVVKQQSQKTQMEQEHVDQDEENQKQERYVEGAVSVAKPLGRYRIVKQAIEDFQRQKLSSLYQANQGANKKEGEDKGEMEEEEEEQEELQGNAKNNTTKDDTNTRASIKKESIKRINEIRKKVDQAAEIDQKSSIEAQEYTRKLQKLQKFVLKKELLYFISSNDFQKKPEVRNMVLPRDPVNKDLMKSYSLTTIKHLEAQYK